MSTVVDVVMPQMGVSVSEGTISQWLKAEGEHIEKDETLLEISTDKVDTEVPSPASGIVSKIHTAEGDTVDVGTLLAQIEIGGAGATDAPAAPAAGEQTSMAEEIPAAPATPTESVPNDPAPAPAAVAAPVAPPAAAPAAVAAPAAAAVPGRFVSPVVARIASEQGIDPNTVPGTGSGGRV
ncbi:MAG: 2-oxoglutarate dehydrogenase component, partial [Thermoleophilia bacterium]|nr:2-oxoglutarate dehydrogenase component [Thermoleophilia bacterium]